MLVVVVVVDAMSQKGEKIGTVQTTLGRAPSREHKVSQRISLVELDEVEKGEDYILEVKGHGRTEIQPFKVDGKVHNTQKSVTIPADEVEEYGLKPGHALNVGVYEKVEETRPFQEQLVETDRQWVYISTVSVVADAEQSDGCDSRVVDEALHNSLDGKEIAKFHNTTTKKEVATGKIKPLSGNDVSFPKKLRKRLNVEPGHKLNVYLQRSEGKEPSENSEMIEEIYKMVSEMHTAYLETKND